MSELNRMQSKDEKGGILNESCCFFFFFCFVLFLFCVLVVFKNVLFAFFVAFVFWIHQLALQMAKQRREEGGR